MKIEKRYRLIAFVLLVVLNACGTHKKEVIREDFKSYYDAYNVRGSFVVYAPEANEIIHYNKAQYDKEFTPASTFKICNSLIGLETGIIRDADFVIKWDSVIRQNANWNRDHDLRSAFKFSTVWYYQELARRVGTQQMKMWLDKCEYGNADTTGGIDKFWLTGGLRITPHEQINFLQRLHDNDLPFSQRTMDIVKDIMIVKDTSDYIIRAKTGWGTDNNMDIGWYVGYVERNGKVYYFANCVQNDDFDNPNFVSSRIEITHQLLLELKIIE